MWKPNVTVAAVVERDGRFLLVEEEANRLRVLNQPAGHLDPGESLAAAAVRETLEETAYTFAPSALVGIYQWQHPDKNVTYLRFAFTGNLTGHDPRRKLDTGIVRALWLTCDELREQRALHRSPLVARCVEDYLAGQRYPLDLIKSWV
jgi:8-oxo-dGTP pyrophosphatase MutT (NUDIX family)